jgi:polyferredoxin
MIGKRFKKKYSPEELAIIYKWYIKAIVVGLVVGGLIILMGKVIPSFGDWITENIWLFISILVLVYAISGFSVGFYLERKLKKMQDKW